MPILESFIDAWNARDPEAVAACYAPDGARVQTAFPQTRIEGRAALVEHVAEIMGAWPDCVLDTRPEIVEGESVVLEWAFRGTQLSDYGPIPGNGQAVELHGTSVIEIGPAGIREERVYWDGATLMASAGLLEP